MKNTTTNVVIAIGAILGIVLIGMIIFFIATPSGKQIVDDWQKKSRPIAVNVYETQIEYLSA